MLFIQTYESYPDVIRSPNMENEISTLREQMKENEIISLKNQIKE